MLMFLEREQNQKQVVVAGSSLAPQILVPEVQMIADVPPSELNEEEESSLQEAAMEQPLIAEIFEMMSSFSTQLTKIEKYLKTVMEKDDGKTLVPALPRQPSVSS